jgi:SAM-dependent methyltransferase
LTNPSFRYAVPPVDEPPLSECWFYQTIEIPGIGVQTGQWDLRPNIANYLGDIDLAGARVLEIGTANGFVCFEMERRGAEVVAFDLAEGITYDAPPLSKEYIVQDHYLDGLRRIRNGYWLAHKRFGSKARVAYGHANRLPNELGQFDVGVIANVLQHLQDPVGAIMQIASRSKTVVITETDWFHGHYDDLNGMIYFDKDNPFVWYQVKPPLVEAVLRRMGFSRFERTDHMQLFVEDPEHQPGKGTISVKMGVNVPHFTIVAYRDPSR